MVLFIHRILNMQKVKITKMLTKMPQDGSKPCEIVLHHVCGNTYFSFIKFVFLTSRFAHEG